MVYNYSKGLALISFLMYLIIVGRYWQHTKFMSKQQQTTLKGVEKSAYWWLFVAISITSVFAFAEPDTYHYHEMYDDLVAYKQHDHLEEVYWLIQKIMPQNYYFWRLGVWGLAAMFITLSCRNLGLSAYTVGFLFPLVYPD